MKRQNIRRFLLVLALLLFPITLYYFSPALIFNGIFHHVMNGSFFVFLAMAVLSIPFGRFFCGWICPAGGLQECLFAVNDRPEKKNWRYWIKYVIWTIWIIGIILCALHEHGWHQVDFFFETHHGISVMDLQSYIIYYGIVLLIVLPALIGGKRAFCHDLCWMAPFMVLGMKIRHVLHLPGLHMESKHPQRCLKCHQCRARCPMSIDVSSCVTEGKDVGSECILCGECADACPRDVLGFSMKKETHHGK